MSVSEQHARVRSTPLEVAAEIAGEQAHVDHVYAELEKAAERTNLVEADGLARGRTSRTGDIRDEEITGLFERDALVFNATKRRASLETQYEGLVFGRLDLDHDVEGGTDGAGTTANSAGGDGSGHHGDSEREVRYIGRLGVRDDDYEPLVIDWRAPAAAPFYRSTPVDPLGVLRRRVLRCKGPVVVGVEDDLMVAEAPDDLVVVGDGALIAALTRTRGTRMRDIVATIQRDQDEAIRAPARGITEITGGPGTGKTVVALHRAAYLLYSERRRFEAGGILVVGPSAAYTAYIERVLPSLGEDTVTLRSLGDVVDGVTAHRLDPPAAAAIKGSLRIRRVLARAARDLIPGAPSVLRVFVGGRPIRLEAAHFAQVRDQVLRNHQRNLAAQAAMQGLAEAAWMSAQLDKKPEFIDTFVDHPEVEAFVREWWRPLDPREVLLWLADRERLTRYGKGVLTADEVEILAASMAPALDTGTWSAADAALIDDLAARLGPMRELPREEREFYEVEELDSLADYGLNQVEIRRSDRIAAGQRYELTPADMRERLLHGTVGEPDEYAHVLVDEAQDLSPMQWRMLGRRGRWSSWTVVGDAAQSSWPDEAESARAREDAFGGNQRQRFHMATNYRNAREIFDYAAEVIHAAVPDADIPEAVRDTGVQPVDRRVTAKGLPGEAAAAVADLLGEVAGSVAVVTPSRWATDLAALADDPSGRVAVTDPMSAKGLEYDATVIIDPEEITREYAGGIRVLYVALTRAAHRMTVLHVEPRPLA